MCIRDRMKGACAAVVLLVWSKKTFSFAKLDESSKTTSELLLINEFCSSLAKSLGASMMYASQGTSEMKGGLGTKFAARLNGQIENGANEIYLDFSWYKGKEVRTNAHINKMSLKSRFHLGRYSSCAGFWHLSHLPSSLADYQSVIFAESKCLKDGHAESPSTSSP